MRCAAELGRHRKLPAGTLNIIAAYSGSANFASSASQAVSEKVNAAYRVLGPASPVSAPSGGTLLIHLIVPSVGGPYNEAVSMSVTGIPFGASASFSPVSLTPGSAGGSTVLTVQLAPLAAEIVDSNRSSPLSRTGFASLILFSALLGVASRNRLRQMANRFVTIAVLGILSFTLASCSGVPVGSHSAHPGSYVITVTGTSGALHASAAFTMVVQ